MRQILSPEQMRAAERRAMEAGTPGIELMERAALHVARAAAEMAGGGLILALCGTGNNGGDGLAAVRLLRGMGADARYALIGDIARMTPDARANLTRLEGMGAMPEPDPRSLRPALLIDALFGTGLTRAPAGDAAEVIGWMNGCGARVLSVDLPAGVDARDGSVPGVAARAERTLTFHAMKVGMALFPGRALCGDVHVCPIGIEGRTEGAIEQLEDRDVEALLPPRAMDAHKGNFGRLLIVAGSLGMAGAAALCARGALHGGAGLTTVATVRDALPIVQTLAPEATALLLPEDGGRAAPGCGHSLAEWLAVRDAAAVGPGMSACEGTRAAVAAVLACGLPCAIDADGLNVLPGLLPRPGVPPVLTPHPGEMARLLGRAVHHPIDDALAYARQADAVVLLKGATTVIATPQGNVTLNTTGTPAMARGGSGDVLTGLIGALLAQGLAPYDAARLGAFLHARAGERAQGRYGLGMTPMDIPRHFFS